MTDTDIILYQPEDGLPAVQVTLRDGTVWLDKARMAELFQRDRSVIQRHISAIYDAGELSPEATCAKSAQVQYEGDREVLREVTTYNLDMIIHVGYRVGGHRGVQFRSWATDKLSQYVVKGFVMDDARLAGEEPNYFDELVERVRRIRTSERNFYEKVLDIFATSIDYDRKADSANEFFATIQNKFHFAITGHTAAEIVSGRVDHSKPNMGLTNWKGSVITANDAKVAKNYLEEIELQRLNLLVEQFLSFAELRSVEKTPMYMADWKRKLDEFLVLNDKQILTNLGSVSRADMEAKVRSELSAFNAKQITAPERQKTRSAARLRGHGSMLARGCRTSPAPHCADAGRRGSDQSSALSEDLPTRSGVLTHLGSVHPSSPRRPLRSDEG